MQFTLVLYLFDFNSPEKHKPMHIFSSREKNIKQDHLSLNILINGKLNSPFMKAPKLWIISLHPICYHISCHVLSG